MTNLEVPLTTCVFTVKNFLLPTCGSCSEVRVGDLVGG